MSGWQKIETAPRTSRAILVYVPSCQCIFAVTWREDRWELNNPVGPGWVTFGGNENIDGATHWMFLPPPPKPETE